MGWDACTTASNHAVDQGFEGLKHDRRPARGQRRRARRHLPHRGRAPDAGDPDDGRRGPGRHRGGTYSLNGFPPPEGRWWRSRCRDARDLLAQASRARDAGADIVIAHLHWGKEYDHLPNPDQVALATRSPPPPTSTSCSASTPTSSSRSPGSTASGSSTAWQHGRPAGARAARTYEGITVHFGSPSARTAAGWSRSGVPPDLLEPLRRAPDPDHRRSRAPTWRRCAAP